MIEVDISSWVDNYKENPERPLKSLNLKEKWFAISYRNCSIQSARWHTSDEGNFEKYFGEASFGLDFNKGFSFRMSFKDFKKYLK